MNESTNRRKRKPTPLLMLARMSEAQAAKCEPYGDWDTACTVICYGHRTEWKSRTAARFFYLTGADVCRGREAERYMRIVRELDSGKAISSDGEKERKPYKVKLPKNADAILADLKAKKAAVAKLMEENRSAGRHIAAQRFADKWNDYALEIIRIERAKRETKANTIPKVSRGTAKRKRETPPCG